MLAEPPSGSALDVAATIVELEAQHVDPLAVDLAPARFGKDDRARAAIEALAQRAQARIEANRQRFGERTGRREIPLSAPELAHDSAQFVRLDAHIELLNASETAEDYQRAKAHALSRLDRLRELVRERAEKARRSVEDENASAAELRYRAEADQAWRDAADGLLTEAIGKPETMVEERFFKKLFWLEFGRRDLDNASWLRETVEASGWPSPSVHGDQAWTDAWTIVQHAAHDVEFQASALGAMREMFARGEGDGRYIALLEDRLAVQAGRPQSYGTQMECHDGSWQPSEIAEPGKVEARRARMGLKPLSESTLVGQAC